MGYTPEGLIKRKICIWLSQQKNCFFWINSSTGIYDPKRGIFRRAKSPFQINGTSDILGIWEGRPLAIEVKAPKKYPSPSQKEFLERFKLMDGIAFVARSVEDVQRELAPGGILEMGGE